jgi:hypothetical protein
VLPAWPFVVALLLASAGTPPPAVPDAAEPHVRAASARMRRLIDETAARSPIVRELVARLGCSDVIVYVELTASPQIPRARTTLVAATPAVRFLRIGISSSIPPNELPALLGHELQHAIEIAERDEVRDDEGVRRLYQEIGRQGSGDSFETDAALDVEWRVRLECREHAASVSPRGGDRARVPAGGVDPGLRPDR